MSAPGAALSAHEARRAIEALRNGVPNRDAVRALGCHQPRAEAAFAALLDRAADAGNPPANAQGMLISGDFGAGKSHLLAHLEHLALSRNFVCSRVAISKETPLYDLGKVYASAVENARMPGRSGRLVEELAPAAKSESEEFADFMRWADKAAAGGPLSPVFPASVRVHAGVADPELESDIESFWAGDRILVSKLRAGLKRIGEAARYKFRAPRAVDLPPQRLRFAVELIRGAGYGGWVVLLDEIELIGSYSILQRGRAYAEAARWMGRAQGEACPGLVAVGAVTEDFASAIIDPNGRKKDRNLVRPRMAASARYAALAARAEAGMRVLERDALTLERPGDEEARAALETLRRLYGQAYGWPPPPAAPAGGAGYRGRMRYKVRAAINEWDLRRLYPDARPDTEFETVAPTYADDPDLEAGPANDGE